MKSILKGVSKIIIQPQIDNLISKRDHRIEDIKNIDIQISEIEKEIEILTEKNKKMAQIMFKVILSTCKTNDEIISMRNEFFDIKNNIKNNEDKIYELRQTRIRAETQMNQFIEDIKKMEKK
jgi:chromosome segregation ATPase